MNALFVRALPLLVLFPLAACNKASGGESSAKGGSSSAKKADDKEANASKTNLDLTLGKDFWGVDSMKLSGPAFLFVRGFETKKEGDQAPYDWELHVYNEGAKATCDTEFGFGHKVGGNGWALSVSNDSSGSFFMKPADLDELHWTMYYPSKLSPEGTNSGNGASNNTLRLKFTKIDGDTAAGEIRGSLSKGENEDVKGTFVAKICTRPTKEEDDND